MRQDSTCILDENLEDLNEGYLLNRPSLKQRHFYYNCMSHLRIGGCLTLRKLKVIQKQKIVSNKKRKGDNCKALGVTEVNARIGTRNEHFLQFISNVMVLPDEYGMKSRHIVLDNTFIHKVFRCLMSNRESRI